MAVLQVQQQAPPLNQMLTDTIREAVTAGVQQITSELQQQYKTVSERVSIAFSVVVVRF